MIFKHLFYYYQHPKQVPAAVASAFTLSCPRRPPTYDTNIGHQEIKGREKEEIG